MSTVALCKCGCGNPVPIAPRTRSSIGWKKGEPIDFIRGHNARIQKNAEKPVLERLQKYVVDLETGCWVWTGALNSKGYARISVRNNRQWDLAYKVMYETLIGPVPEGRHLHHVCENRACVRPDGEHVTPVTPAWHINHHINDRLRAA